MDKLFLLFLSAHIAVVLSASQHRYKLPSFIGVCSRNENDLSSCVKDKAQKTLAGLVQGSKEIGLAPLDPLEIQEMSFDFERDAYKIAMTLRDNIMYGISKLKVQDARTNVTEQGGLNMELDIFIPRLYLEGQFKLSGHLARIPINGKGYYNVSVADMTATWRIETVPVKRDGEYYLEAVRFPINYTMKDMKMYATDLIEGAPELSAFALQAVNQFWPFLTRETNEFTAEPFERYMKIMANKVLLSYPMSVLFP